MEPGETLSLTFTHCSAGSKYRSGSRMRKRPSSTDQSTLGTVRTLIVLANSAWWASPVTLPK